MRSSYEPPQLLPLPSGLRNERSILSSSMGASSTFLRNSNSNYIPAYGASSSNQQQQFAGARLIGQREVKYVRAPSEVTPSTISNNFGINNNNNNNFSFAPSISQTLPSQSLYGTYGGNIISNSNNTGNNFSNNYNNNNNNNNAIRPISVSNVLNNNNNNNSIYHSSPPRFQNPPQQQQQQQQQQQYLPTSSLSARSLSLSFGPSATPVAAAGTSSSSFNPPQLLALPAHPPSHNALYSSAPHATNNNNNGSNSFRGNAPSYASNYSNEPSTPSYDAAGNSSGSTRNLLLQSLSQSGNRTPGRDGWNDEPLLRSVNGPLSSQKLTLASGISSVDASSNSSGRGSSSGRGDAFFNNNNNNNNSSNSGRGSSSGRGDAFFNNNNNGGGGSGRGTINVMNSQSGGTPRRIGVGENVSVSQQALYSRSPSVYTVASAIGGERDGKWWGVSSSLQSGKEPSFSLRRELQSGLLGKSTPGTPSTSSYHAPVAAATTPGSYSVGNLTHNNNNNNNNAPLPSSSMWGSVSGKQVRLQVPGSEDDQPTRNATKRNTPSPPKRVSLSVADPTYISTPSLLDKSANNNNNAPSSNMPTMIKSPRVFSTILESSRNNNNNNENIFTAPNNNNNRNASTNEDPKKNSRDILRASSSMVSHMNLLAPEVLHPDEEQTQMFKEKRGGDWMPVLEENTMANSSSRNHELKVTHHQSQPSQLSNAQQPYQRQYEYGGSNSNVDGNRNYLGQLSSSSPTKSVTLREQHHSSPSKLNNINNGSITYRGDGRDFLASVINNRVYEANERWNNNNSDSDQHSSGGNSFLNPTTQARNVSNDSNNSNSSSGGLFADWNRSAANYSANGTPIHATTRDLRSALYGGEHFTNNPVLMDRLSGYSKFQSPGSRVPISVIPSSSTYNNSNHPYRPYTPPVAAAAAMHTASPKTAPSSPGVDMSSVPFGRQQQAFPDSTPPRPSNNNNNLRNSSSSNNNNNNYHHNNHQVVMIDVTNHALPQQHQQQQQQQQSTTVSSMNSPFSGLSRVAQAFAEVSRHSPRLFDVVAGTPSSPAANAPLWTVPAASLTPPAPVADIIVAAMNEASRSSSPIHQHHERLSSAAAFSSTDPGLVHVAPPSKTTDHQQHQNKSTTNNNNNYNNHNHNNNSNINNTISDPRPLLDSWSRRISSGQERGFVDNYMFPAPTPSYTGIDFPAGYDLIWFPVDSTLVGVPLTPGCFISTKLATHVVIYMHSNAVDVGLILSTLVAFARRLHVHIFAIEYPGYGACGGAASEVSVNAVAKGAVMFLQDHLNVPPSRIILFGSSIGTGPATRLAADMSLARCPPAALVLQSPFLSIKSLAEHLVGSAVALFVAERFENEKWITQVSCPTLILHGQKDRIAPFFHGERLFKACRAEGKALFGPRSAGHDDLDFDNHMIKPITEFLAQKIPEYNRIDTAITIPNEKVEIAKRLPPKHCRGGEVKKGWSFEGFL